MYTRSEYKTKYSNYLWRLGEQIEETTNSTVTVSQEATQHYSVRGERCNEELSFIVIGKIGIANMLMASTKLIPRDDTLSISASTSRFYS
jgi:hypothetical protein